MSILVTGGAGFISSKFIHSMLRDDSKARIVDLDALTYAGARENLEDLPDSGRHIFVRGDIGHRGLLGRLLRRHRIRMIVHLRPRRTSAVPSRIPRRFSGRMSWGLWRCSSPRASTGSARRP